MPRGRPPVGPSLVDSLDAPGVAKKRLRTIFEVIAGQKTADEGCAVLGISRARFYILQSKVFEAGIEALLPRPTGRPPIPKSEESLAIRALEARIRDLELELQAAMIREEIARTVPQVANREAGKKKRP